MNKVYLVLHTLSIGGAERHVSTIANHLVNKGFETEIILLDNKNIQYKLADNIKVVSLADMDSPKQKKVSVCCAKLSLKAFSFFSQKKYKQKDLFLYLKNCYINKLKQYLKTRNEISNSTVISFMTYPNIVAAAAIKDLPCKLILAEFNSPHLEFEPDSPQNFLKQKFFPLTTGFVFQTDEQKDFYSFLPNVKKQVILNPLENIAVEPFCGERKKEIVNYCRLSIAKNLPLLIEAFALLSKEFPDYSLTIYGDGPLKEQILQCIKNFDLQSKAFIKPFNTNVLELVRDSAMFVSSSDREGISNSMIEAMAIGLPSVCTDCPAGGAKMLIKPYYNGIIVPTKDAKAMYEAMKYMILNPEQANTMGKHATEIKTLLEKEKILNQWVDFIIEISG